MYVLDQVATIGKPSASPSGSNELRLYCMGGKKARDTQVASSDSRQFAKKTGSHKSKTDRGRVDNATLVKNNHYGIHEYAGHHKNYAAKGLRLRKRTSSSLLTK